MLRRLVAVGGVAGAVAAIAFVWWPNGDYEPIRPGEKGTVTEAIKSIEEIPSGRPSLSAEQAARFASEPTERERLAPRGVAPHDGEDGDGDDGITSPDPGATDESRPGDEDFDSGEEPPDRRRGDHGPLRRGDARRRRRLRTRRPRRRRPRRRRGTPTGSATTTPAPTATATPTPTATPTATATPSPTTTPSATSTPAPQATALASPSATPGAASTPSSEPTPLPTP